MYKTILTICMALGAFSLTVAPATAQAAHPVFSPDGTALAWYSYDLEAGQADIHVLWPEAARRHRLATGLAWAVNPAWSADGRALYFVGSPDGMRGDWDLYRMDLTHGEAERVLERDGREAHVQASPDGRFLSFVTMGPDNDVYLLDLEHDQIRRMTRTDAQEFHPRWSDDSRRLAFDRHLDGDVSQIVELDVASGREVVLDEARGDERVSLPTSNGHGGWMWARNAPDAHRLVTGHGDAIHPLYTHDGDADIGASAWRPGTQIIVLSLHATRMDSALYRLEAGRDRIEMIAD